MDFFNRYFWFLCGAFVLLSLLVLRRRLAELVRRNRVTRDEASRFLRGAALAITPQCAALGAISLLAGYRNPGCARPFSFADAPSAATNTVILVSWGALLLWVWRGRGADLLGRIGPAFKNRPDYTHTYSPRAVRFAVTGLLLLAAVGGFFGSMADGANRWGCPVVSFRSKL
jgi:hypothetical protein